MSLETRDIVTRSECTEYQKCIRAEIREAVIAEKHDREKELAELRGWMVRIETRIDAMSSKLSAVILELLIGLILVILTILFGSIH
ncbi:hypothetical protein [Methanosalsum natronophilum]|uniref:hypothetical protein n=1 Tax=Methanosalsum natronophilum TaxID=768733 RepID=UPI002166DC59|nr:hypothetical protein [Methanosalsum natronophilum]MCS3923828.1 hypothetical protein [Methanosalsum natronophilum]